MRIEYLILRPIFKKLHVLQPQELRALQVKNFTSHSFSCKGIIAGNLGF
jgi:hypothetical protein